MNVIPATSGTFATLAAGATLSVIGWGFDREGEYALTVRGIFMLDPDVIKEIKHADGRTEKI